MKYMIKQCFVAFSLALIMIICSGSALSAEPLYNLSYFLNTSDPVKSPATEDWKTGAEIIADNIHNAQWDAPLLRSPIGFEALRYAYENDLIDKDEFLDAQDYLQIQADFASPETQAFEGLVTEGKLPVRVPAAYVARIHYSEYIGHQTPKIITEQESDVIERFGWITSVEVAPEFYRAFKQVNTSICNDELDGGDFLRCRARIYQDERMELLSWYGTLDANLIGLSSSFDFGDGGKMLSLGSIPLYLSFIKKKYWYPSEFIPLYGELVWEDLLSMREHDKNPGTIYHPNVASNFFRPHGLYGGASVFLRHDLIHQRIISAFSTRERRFLAWLHRQEESIIKRMDKSYSHVYQEEHRSYNNGSNNVTAVKLGRLCLGKRKPLEHASYKKGSVMPEEHYWASPGSHRLLFSGVFADMGSTVKYDTYTSRFLSAFDGRWSSGYLDMGKTLKSMLENQCQHAGYYYSASFKLYHGLLENLLTENRDHILSEFGLSVDEILSSASKD